MKLVIEIGSGYSVFLKDGEKTKRLFESKISLISAAMFCVGFRKIFPDTRIEFSIDYKRGAEFDLGEQAAEQYEKSRKSK